MTKNQAISSHCDLGIFCTWEIMGVSHVGRFCTGEILFPGDYVRIIFFRGDFGYGEIFYRGYIMGGNRENSIVNPKMVVKFTIHSLVTFSVKLVSETLSEIEGKDI